MSNLQFFGIFISVVIFYFSVRYYRQRKGKTAFAIGVLVALGLGFVSYTPDTFNVFFDFITTSRNQFYRIIILLILGIIFLFTMQLRNLFITESHERSLNEIVRKHSVKEFRYEFDDELIKPIQIVIPAYNEAENLMKLLPELPDSIQGTPMNALIVSDGSGDETARVARENGFPVVENLVNAGGGSALQTGFEIARSRGAEIIVTMDADGQHDTDDLTSIIEPILEDEADLVVGSRQLGETVQDNRLRRGGILFFNRLISFLMGTTITDCSNNYRAFRADLLGDLELEETQYHTTEFLIQALDSGAEYKEVPITVLQRQHGQSKKGPDLLYGLRFFRVLVRTWWGI